MTNRLRLGALGVATALVLTACGAPAQTQSTSETSTQAASAAASAAASGASDSTESAAADPSGEASATDAGDLEDAETSSTADGAADTFTTDDTQGGMAQGGGSLIPVEVRTGTHGDVTRVVVEYSGTTEPGWAAGYVGEAIEQGRGEPIAIDGDALLSVTLRGLGYPETQQQTDSMVSGAVTPSAPGVRDLFLDPAYEGQAVLYIGLDSEVPYEVTTLSDPQRVVIDIRTGS